MAKPTTYKGNVTRVMDNLQEARRAIRKAYDAAHDAQRLAWRALSAAANAHIADPTPANAGRVRTARKRAAAADKRMTAIRNLRDADNDVYVAVRDANDRGNA